MRFMDNNATKVSVITPAYNAEKYISEAVESILDQTFSNFEYIVLDDRSDDDTAKIVEKYSEEDERIVLIRNPRRLGISENRNEGVRRAKGKYIVWQDADDISYPDRIKKQYEFMERHPDVGILGGFLDFFDNSGTKGTRKYDEGDEALRRKIFMFSPVAQPAAIVRKDVLNQVGGYDSKYVGAEDLDMSFRIGMKYKFANLQEPLIKYRQHPDSTTFRRLRDLEKNTLEIRRKYSRTIFYSMSVLDRIYNFLERLSMFVVPVYIKIWIFNLLRNN